MPNVQKLFNGLINRNRIALSRCVTLVETSRMARRPEISQLMNMVYNHNQENVKEDDTFRIGVSGPPGVGKSSFINALGSYLLARDKKNHISVLTVDPTSPHTGGSVLGDALRMHDMIHSDRVFIRSTPSSGYLGGVHRRTPYAIQLSEAAGHTVTLVETVGAGQSEVAIAGMVDIFIVLVPPAGGDEFQAIKKGIMEMADLVVITKNDSIHADACTRTYADYLSVMKLFPLRPSGWHPMAAKVSNITGDGIPWIWKQMLKNKRVSTEHGYFHQNRCHQFENLFRTELELQLSEKVFGIDYYAQLADELQFQVASGKMWPSSAARAFIAELSKSLHS